MSQKRKQINDLRKEFENSVKNKMNDKQMYNTAGY